MTATTTPPLHRDIRDYLCSDGQPPDAMDNQRDDTAAVQAALAGGPGVVRIGPGHYRFGDVTIPTDTALVGAGSATVIRSNGAKRIFSQVDVDDWSLRDVFLDGESSAELFRTPDNGRQAIFVKWCCGIEIRNVSAVRFEGKAVELSYSKHRPQRASFCDGGVIAGLTVRENYAGLVFYERAEYIAATQVMSYFNQIGCVIHGGNITIGDSHICTNNTGIYMRDMENGSHGGVSNCLINHNNDYAIDAEDVGNGHNFIGCDMICGAIRLVNCKGVKICSGTLHCSLIVEGPDANLFMGNWVLEMLMETCDLSPATLLRNNFDDHGPWDGPKKAE